MRIVLDTWIFLDPSKPSKDLLDRVRRGALEAVVSTITYAELYSLLYKRVSDGDVKSFKRNLERLGLRDRAITKEIAEEGGRYKAKYGFSIADGIIVATAVTEHATLLVTGDPDFNRVEEIKAATPEKTLRELGGIS